MQNLPKLQIKNQQEFKLIEGHPWIYSNCIANFAELKTLEKGSLVEVCLPKKPAFAIAYFNPNQLIAGRILTYDASEIIDEKFFEKRILTAKILREKFFDKPFYRLIHSEADGLAGLVIDRFDDILSCQISTLGMEKLQDFLILALKKLFPNCKIIFKNDSESRKFEGLEVEIKTIHGEISGQKTIEENGVKFNINIESGQKTGWYYDQRKNREFVGSISSGAEVLDAFCYQGSFGLNALKNGAKSVTFIDSSQEAVDRARSNVELNDLNIAKCEFVCEKAFVALEKMASASKQFDIIVLDPPAFVKTKKDLHSGLKGYEKLVRLALPLLKTNGILFLASCSHNVSLDDLTDAANKATRKFFENKKTAKLVRTFGADIDHPLHPTLKESEYLKSIAFFI